MMKLREKKACRLSRLPKGVFRRILEYCEPYNWRVTEFKYFNKKINFVWPEVFSYNNPIVGVKDEGYAYMWCFFLQNRQMSFKAPDPTVFKDLDWSVR